MKNITALIVASALTAISLPKVEATEIRLVSQDNNQFRFTISDVDNTGELISGLYLHEDGGLRKRWMARTFGRHVWTLWDPEGPHLAGDHFILPEVGIYMPRPDGFTGQDWSYANGTWSFTYRSPFFTPALDTDPPRRPSVPDSGSSALLLLIGVAALAIGCTKTKIERRADGSWSINRSSLFQKLEIPGATVATNGTWTLKGYSNDGGAQALEGMLKAAAEGAAKGAK